MAEPTLEGCGDLYEQCRQAAADFEIRVEAGRLLWQATVHDMLFAGACTVGTTNYRDTIAMYNLLLRALVALREARGIIAPHEKSSG